MINKKDMGEEEYKIMKNEALILHEMNHPNIVKFYDVILILSYNLCSDIRNSWIYLHWNGIIKRWQLKVIDGDKESF
jgi:serine/threonine protein kinase